MASTISSIIENQDRDMLRGQCELMRSATIDSVTEIRIVVCDECAFLFIVPPIW
jgi:hypothetical protein